MSSIREPAFVPLSASALAGAMRSQFQTKMAGQPAVAQPFRNLSDKISINPSLPHAGTCEPQVTLKREGDRVSAIQVQCSCGQLIELACVYETSAQEAKTSSASSAP